MYSWCTADTHCLAPLSHPWLPTGDFLVRHIKRFEEICRELEALPKAAPPPTAEAAAAPAAPKSPVGVRPKLKIGVSFA